MTDTAFDHPMPWTESEYFALGETTNRVELIDGCLLVSPHGGIAHQAIAANLRDAFAVAARVNGFRVDRTNLRLGPDRITDPDLVVDPGPVSTRGATIVGEVLEDTSVLTDQVLKRTLYAAAGIPWYLLVEPSFPDYESVTVRLLRLAGDHYVKHLVAEHGQALTSDDPFPFEIRTEDLVGF